MASVGPNTAGTASSDAGDGSGTFSWTDTAATAALDAAYTIAASNASGTRYSRDLRLSNFGFSVPAGATINGVVAHIHRKYYYPVGGGCYDYVVKLVKAGAITGDNKASADMWGIGTIQDITYGAADNLWGVSLGVDDVNASNFGLVLQVYHVSALVRVIESHVDYVTMTVYYTAGAAATFMQRTVSF